ncbi:hypothetical protein F750_5125 [Streptomyces sp. PAMC 26508]|nr:hypothetical protein F750_5125 [Streptomyces sp. PAMC 26508]
MHAAGLYLSLPVSLMKVQGTSDGRRRAVGRGRSRGEREKGRRSVPGECRTVCCAVIRAQPCVTDRANRPDPERSSVVQDDDP